MKRQNRLHPYGRGSGARPGSAGDLREQYGEYVQLDAPTAEHPTTLVMWAYADPRDVAEAHVRSVDANLDGHTSFMIAQPTTRFAEPTIDLIAIGPSLRWSSRPRASPDRTHR